MYDLSDARLIDQLTVPGALDALSHAQRLALAAALATELGPTFQPAPALLGERNYPGLVHVASNITFVLIPAGAFEMGLTDADLAAYRALFTPEALDELAAAEELDDLTWSEAFIARLTPRSRPTRRVTVAPFAMALRSVNIDQIEALSGTRPSTTAFATPGLARAVFARHGLRLPTEAEWEYVARQGADAPFLRDAPQAYLGLPAPRAYPNDHTVFGINGLIGEWVDDAWHDDYVGAPSTSSQFRLASDPEDAPGVCRGNCSAGQCFSQAAMMFVAFRFKEGALEDNYWGPGGHIARPVFGPDAAGRWRLSDASARAATKPS